VDGDGVLAAYASRGTRELLNGTVYADGTSSRLAGADFVGQHICTPLRGVAIGVNAFNLVWGPLESSRPPSWPGCRAW
jgi:oxepin-CoA hydrolase/3-oxo-5,6-dehydrosuberyl-CoA semialdehyde dehydrogenase